MKRIPLVLAAVVPFAVMAEGTGGSQDLKVDAEKLRQATPASVLLNEELKTKDGKDAGTLEEIIVSRDGKVQHFLVDVNREELREQRAGDDQRQDMDIVATDTRRDSSAKDPVYEQSSAESSEQERSDSRQAQAEPVYEQSERRETRSAERSGDAWMTDKLTKISPESVSYDNKSKTAKVDEKKAMKAEQVSEDRAAQGRDSLRVSEVIGMEVHLQDEESFGSVEDVMLSKDNSEVVAIVVDNWDGLSKERRALPMKNAQIDAQNDELELQASLNDVKALPEFNLDRYTEDGWDLTEW